MRENKGEVVCLRVDGSCVISGLEALVAVAERDGVGP